MNYKQNDTISLRVGNNISLFIGVKDLLGAPVDVIVNPANSGLSHGGGLAAVISDEAGPRLDERCEQIIRKIGRVPVTMAVPTKAFRLPFKGIIHAVGPRMGDGDEQEKLAKTVHNCLYLADRNEWNSIAFPALGTGIFRIPLQTCAMAFKAAIGAYCCNRDDSKIENIWLCLTIDAFPVFSDLFGSVSKQGGHRCT